MDKTIVIEEEMHQYLLIFHRADTRFLQDCVIFLLFGSMVRMFFENKGFKLFEIKKMEKLYMILIDLA